MNTQRGVSQGWTIKALLAELTIEGLADHRHGAIYHHPVQAITESGARPLDGDPIVAIRPGPAAFAGNRDFWFHRLRR
ncbi:hypothetical protein HHA02_07260 [Cobetia marina]|nr:hypothetical protein HHA02_07260 [Cobetia marina]